MKKIKLANNRGTALVDDDDFDRVSQFKWCILEGLHTNYAQTSIYPNGRHTTVSMHRLIMNKPKKMHVDHKDGNGLNNQQQNLRLCTRSQNLGNSLKRKGCSSKFKGVTWNKRDKKWKAHGCLNSCFNYLGYFDDEQEAAQAYNVWAVKAFGEFAQLNKLEDSNA